MVEIEDKEESRYGRDKSKTVERSLLESGDYRRKFDFLTDNTELNKSLYQIAKKILLHRSGTDFEDMYWLDGDSGKVFAAITDMNVPSKIIYPKDYMQRFKHIKNKITIHNHPVSMPPSISDFESAYHNGYNKCIIVCHDGTVYSYSCISEPDKDVYDTLLSEYSALNYSDFTSQLKTLNVLAERKIINFKEIIYNDLLRR